MLMLWLLVAVAQVNGQCMVRSNGATSVVVTWSSSLVTRSARFYDVRCNCTDSGDSLIFARTSNTTVTVGNLRPTTQYMFDVSALTSNGTLVGLLSCSIKNGIIRGARLRDSVLDAEGRLEINFDSIWGTVCDDAFDDTDAAVACFMLGFRREGRSLGNRYGAGRGRIWLDNVNCVGDELSLSECGHVGLGINNCAHDEDVSIACTGAAENNSRNPRTGSPSSSSSSSRPLSAPPSSNSHLGLPDVTSSVL